MLGVLLAGPDQLHWPADGLGDGHDLGDIVEHEAPSEAAAQIGRVDRDPLGRQAGDRGHHPDDEIDPLVGRDDLAGVGRDLRRAVHRLHGRMGEERRGVGRLEPARGGRHRAGDVALALRGHPRLVEPGLELCEQAVAGQTGVGALVIGDRQRLDRFAGAPEAVRHDSDAARDLVHRNHAGHAADRSSVVAGDGRAEHRIVLHCGIDHAGQAGVDAELGGAVDLERRVGALGRGADQTELRRVLERWRGRRLEPRGCIGQGTIVERAAGSGVHDLAGLGRAFGRIDAPLVRGRLDQHGPRGGARLAHHVVRAAHARAAAGDPHLTAEEHLVSIARRGLLDRERRQIGVQLLGHDLRDRRIGALTHLDERVVESDPAVGRDPEEGRHLRGLRSAGAGHERQTDAEHEAACGDRRAAEEGAPAEIDDRHGRVLPQALWSSTARFTPALIRW